MDKGKQNTMVNELNDFCGKLLKYAAYRKRQISDKGRLPEKQSKELASLYREISVSVGKYALLIKECTGLDTITTSAGPQDIWNWALSLLPNPLVVSALDNCLQATYRTIGRLKDDIDKGIRDEQGNLKVEAEKLQVRIEEPKAFIAHEGETEQLKRLKDFLDALGIKYFIAEAEASDGRSVEKQVDWTQSKADFAICLATKGKAINKKTGRHYMGLNVADELGRARQVFGNKIILLVQKGVEVHTNTREIVYAEFTTTSMDKAFIKVLKELKNWHFIRAGKFEETSP